MPFSSKRKLLRNRKREVEDNKLEDREGTNDKSYAVFLCIQTTRNTINKLIKDYLIPTEFSNTCCDFISFSKSGTFCNSEFNHFSLYLFSNFKRIHFKVMLNRWKMHYLLVWTTHGHSMQSEPLRTPTFGQNRLWAWSQGSRSENHDWHTLMYW